MVYNFFDKKTSARRAQPEKRNKLEISLPVVKMRIFETTNQLENYTNQLLETLRKESYINSFIDNIWSADLADMQLISKSNKRFRFL